MTHTTQGRLAGRPSFKWVVEIEVNETWVEDGFNLDQERLQDAIGQMLPHANALEYHGKVIQRPDPKAIKEAQGA